MHVIRASSKMAFPNLRTNEVSCCSKISNETGSRLMQNGGQIEILIASSMKKESKHSTINIDDFKIPVRLSCWSVGCPLMCRFLQLVLGSLNPTPQFKNNFSIGYTLTMWAQLVLRKSRYKKRMKNKKMRREVETRQPWLLKTAVIYF